MDKNNYLYASIIIIFLLTSFFSLVEIFWEDNGTAKFKIKGLKKQFVAESLDSELNDLKANRMFQTIRKEIAFAGTQKSKEINKILKRNPEKFNIFWEERLEYLERFYNTNRKKLRKVNKCSAVTHLLMTHLSITKKLKDRNLSFSYFSFSKHRTLLNKNISDLISTCDKNVMDPLIIYEYQDSLNFDDISQYRKKLLKKFIQESEKLLTDNSVTGVEMPDQYVSEIKNDYLPKARKKLKRLNG